MRRTPALSRARPPVSGRALFLTPASFRLLRTVPVAFVGDNRPWEFFWKEAIEYLRNTPAIRDVVISGGDTLTLSDEKIE